jgi:cyclopropane fatty-acyl-phospholipid synthase-like methyltransferase
MESLYRREFPRSSAYDPAWVLEAPMGPNSLWLAEWLTERLDLRPGMRVLDLGCGRAKSSIFLAKEFGVQVWATDLWVPASENQNAITSAGLDGSVFAIHAEAHDLPFEEGFFDVALGFDSYHYFGTDDMYLGYISSFVKPAGTLAFVSPGLERELDAEIPERLRPYWSWEFWAFHSPDWWRSHWAKTGLVDVEAAEMMPNGPRHWLDWLEICMAKEGGEDGHPAKSDADMLRADEGQLLGFVRVVAQGR